MRKAAGRCQSLNRAAFLLFSKLVAGIKGRFLGEAAVMLFFPLQRSVRRYLAEFLTGALSSEVSLECSKTLQPHFTHKTHRICLSA